MTLAARKKKQDKTKKTLRMSEKSVPGGGKTAFLFVSSDGFMLKPAVRPFAACFYRIRARFICGYYLGHLVIWAVTQHGSYL